MSRAEIAVVLIVQCFKGSRCLERPLDLACSSDAISGNDAIQFVLPSCDARGERLTET